MPNTAEHAKPTEAEQKPKDEYSYKKGIALLAGVFIAPVVLWMIDAVVPWGWFGKPFLYLVAPRDPSEFWQFIEGSAGMLVLYIAYRGLKALGLAQHEIVLTKHEMVTRAQREAAHAAIVQCERFSKEILARGHAINVAKAPDFVKSFANLNFDQDNEEQVKQAFAWFNALEPEVRNTCSNFLNDLEAWCMPFTSGVADPQIAYGPCATPFFALVVQYYPFLLVFRRANRISGRYPNTVDLFGHWRKKRSAADMDKILKRMQELDDKGPDLPPTIGTTAPKLD